MKVIIEGITHFEPGFQADRDAKSGPMLSIEVIGAPDEDIGEGRILLVHPDVSLELNAGDLRRALRVLEERRGNAFA